MSIFSLVPWFLTAIILSVIFFMIIGMMVKEEKAIIAFIIICGITLGSVVNCGITYNAQMYDREVNAESNIICLKAEKVHLINKLNEIKKIQIANNSDHIEYVQDHIDDLENTNEFLLYINIEAAKDAVNYINNNPWLLK